MSEPELYFLVLGARGGTSLQVEKLSSAILELEPTALNFFKLPVAKEPFEDEQCGGKSGARSCNSLLDVVGRWLQLLPDSEAATSGQPPIWIHSCILNINLLISVITAESNLHFGVNLTVLNKS